MELKESTPLITPLKNRLVRQYLVLARSDDWGVPEVGNTVRGGCEVAVCAS